MVKEILVKMRPMSVIMLVALLFSGVMPVLATGGQIGVIMGSEGCPGGAAPLTIHIDNEDSNNDNDRGGWIGSTTSNAYSTTFNFCRVSGANFWPIGQSYMVLSLGSYCPNGSQTVGRRFDSENNDSWSSSNIDGLAEGLPSSILYGGDDKDVNMFFCLFHGTGGTWGTLPSVGVQYGVFAAADFAPALSTGFVYLDDENSLVGWGLGINKNMWCEDTNWPYGSVRSMGNCVPAETGNYWDPYTSPYRLYAGASNIMDGGLNTKLNLAQVQGTVCGNGVCRGAENCSSCPSDCGACSVCGDSSCTGDEFCYTCPVDCGVCSGCIFSGANRSNFANLCAE